MATEQRLFDNIEAGKRKRNYHHKVIGNRAERIARWQRFLRAVKLAQENGEKNYMSQLQSKYNVGKFRADLLPRDLDTISYEDITIEYAEQVMISVTEDYKKQQRRKQQVEEQPQGSQIIVIPQDSIDAKSLIGEVLSIIDEFYDKLSQILTRYNKAK